MDEQTSEPTLQPRRRLGRGLNALLGGDDESTPAVESGEFLQLAIEGIARNPYQPRKDFEPEALRELADSITQHGVLQPLLVRVTDAGYQLIAGERRLLAAQAAGLKTVPCRVVVLEEQAVCEVAIIENLQRSDLGELEKAQAFQTYLEKFGGSIEDLAKRLGKDRSTVSNCLRLLELPEFVKQALRGGKIAASHGRALLPLEEEADQIAMCQRIQSESLSVRQTEEAVRLKLAETPLTFAPPPVDEQPARPTPPVNQHVLSLQEQLRDVVGAKVEIKMKGKDAGRMIIHFGSNEEFERIVQQLRKAS